MPAIRLFTPLIISLAALAVILAAVAAFPPGSERSTVEIPVSLPIQ